MARTREPPGWTSQFREIVLDIALTAHDLRTDPELFRAALDPDDYTAAQALGRAPRQYPTASSIPACARRAGTA